MRTIDADSLKSELAKWFPMASLDGIKAKTLFAQIMHDIDNAPTVEPEITNGDLQAAMTESYRLGYELAETKFKRPQGDLISREALKEKLQARLDNGEEDFDKGYNIGIETAIDLIDNSPTVDTTKAEHKAYNEGFKDGVDQGIKLSERPQGEWLFHRCSLCGRYDARDNENFCSNCGADMRKGGAEND